MGDSSESGWEKSTNSYGSKFNTYYTGSSERQELINGGRLGLSRDASNNVGNEKGYINLRQWLDRSERSIDHFECLHIFRQIVEIVNQAHLQDIVVHNVRPSCFVLSSFNSVSFIGSYSCSSSESDKVVLNNQNAEGKFFPSSSHHELLKHRRIRLSHEESPMEILSSANVSEKEENFKEEIEVENHSKFEVSTIAKKNIKLKRIVLMENSWYTSPEEFAGAPSSFSSDIYRLGVLLFELFCTFTSVAEKLRTMSSLRHRVLPPNLLLNWSKEASFCLWLLHPQTNTRPKMIEVVKSDFLSEPKDNVDELEAAFNLKKEIEEHELLLEFLLEIQRRKNEAANKLHDAICCLTSDIEVLKQKLIRKIKKKEGSLDLKNTDQLSLNPLRNDDLTIFGSRKRYRQKIQIHGHDEEFNERLNEFQICDQMKSEKSENVLTKSSRLIENFTKLESAYFSTRCRTMKPTEKSIHKGCQLSSNCKGSIVLTEGSEVGNLCFKDQNSEGTDSERINPFLDGLCKYLSFSKLKVRAELKQGDLLNSSNLVCAMSFDRDKEFFATAGVNKKIKIFEYDMILKEDYDMHYPVMEMASRSKLSSICWNSYIQSQVASSDFEGVVQVWDVMRGQVFREMREHEKRVWSVDFSSADPTKLVSGSDDGSVKLWNINQAILFLHLVDETKRRKYWYHQNKSQRLLRSIRSRFFTFTCSWFGRS